MIIGPSSVTCAETLRQEGFKGRIVIATKENVLPYDRPKLSKALHLTAEEIQLRPPSFYHNNNIEVLLEKEVQYNIIIIYGVELTSVG